MTFKNSACIRTLYLFSVIHSVIPLVSQNDISRLVFGDARLFLLYKCSLDEFHALKWSSFVRLFMFVVIMMYRSIFARNCVASLFAGFMSGAGWALLENVA
jgi:hypothetical protein